MKKRNAASHTSQTRLIKLTPGRMETQPLIGMENLLSSLPVGDAVALELSGDAEGIRYFTRSSSHTPALKSLLQGHYSQSEVADVSNNDPMAIRPGEMAHTRTLRVDGPEYLPIRTFEDSDLINPGADPLMAVLGSLEGPREAERIVSRLVLKRLPPDWAAQWHDRGMGGAGSANQTQSDEIRAQSDESTIGMGEALKLGGLALVAVGFLVWQAYNDGNTLRAAALLGGAGLLSATAALLYFKVFKKKGPLTFHDPAVVAPRIKGAGFEAEIQISVIQPKTGGTRRAEDLLDAVEAAYSGLDNPLGSQLVASPTIEGGPKGDALLQLGWDASQARGLRARLAGPPDTSMLGASEVAALWHPPHPDASAHPVVRHIGKSLPPMFTAQEGAHIGNTDGMNPKAILLSDDSLRRHALYAARTRMGKSTLIQHVIAYKMRRKLEGKDDDAIVVVDPHADLVEALLELVPPGLEDRVRLIDLADPERVPGINPVDVGVFTDRDRTADGIVRVAKGSWESWGARMQNILEHTVKSLHEANSSPSMNPADQYTLMDAQTVLSNEQARNRMLRQVSDLHLLRWWHDDFLGWDQRYRNEAVAPVQTRLAYYASSIKARQVLGQPQSTLDIRRCIQEGDILFVSTAQSTVGRDVSALIGACILNLVDAVIRQQGQLPPTERRSVMLAIDEMQSIPGVDYEGMLSEVGKFGGALTFATQSLSKLDELSPTLRDVILANNGLLVVFQVAAVDAARLVHELDSERVTEDDITSLPVHHCYVRATANGQRMPAFSMKLRPPEVGNYAVAERIRQASAEYTTPASVVDRLVERNLADDLADWRAGLNAMQSHVTMPDSGAGQGAAAGQPNGSNRRPAQRDAAQPDAKPRNRLRD